MVTHLLNFSFSRLVSVVDYYLVHLQYNYDESGAPVAFDIALLLLKQPIIHSPYSNRKSLTLCAANQFRYGTLIGLGLTNQNPDIPSQQLMQSRLQRVERDRVLNLAFSVDSVSQNVLKILRKYLGFD